MYTQQEELQRDGLKGILVDCWRGMLKGESKETRWTVERDFKGIVLSYCWKGNTKGLF